MSNRKLWTSALCILHRRLYSSPRFSAGFHLNLESTSVFSCSPYHAGKSIVSGSCKGGFMANFKFSVRGFCSEPVVGSVDKCWNCGTLAMSKPFLACESCKSVQPVDPSIDYFQIFGLEKEYDVKVDNLESKYKDWQKKLHPDLVHSKSEKEREYAAEQSARVIDAYYTLSKPLSRATYMLKLEGVHVDEEKTISEPDFLAEIMEVREAVEEAEDSQALNQIQHQMQGKLESWFKSFANAFKNQEYEAAVTSIQRMTYYERVKEEILKKM
ncbi:PREDICTED: uncharacterized protein LOC104601455 [Nelumbo nucifera]|uniref:J domain-containing protein n=2 Tax=Nelumbo nucifera TaxID=4432 RepID=A0A822YDG6_NELNU|nr:PREDICTED: uncharacterized protein LOC104601455 [Nelumbo nucifera]DAD29015.1 TPA_asm: hypothetical protein HUJ06_030483 [Nelumbo nucifera]